MKVWVLSCKDADRLTGSVCGVFSSYALALECARDYHYVRRRFDAPYPNPNYYRTRTYRGTYYAIVAYELDRDDGGWEPSSGRHLVGREFSGELCPDTPAR